VVIVQEARVRDVVKGVFGAVDEGLHPEVQGFVHGEEVDS